MPCFGAAWLLLLCLLVGMAVTPAWAKKDKWGEVTGPVTPTVVKYLEIQGSLAPKALSGDLFRRAKATMEEYEAVLLDAVGNRVAAAPVSAEGKWAFSGISVQGRFEVELRHPQGALPVMIVAGMAETADENGMIALRIDRKSTVETSLARQLYAQTGTHERPKQPSEKEWNKALRHLEKVFDESLKTWTRGAEPTFSLELEKQVRRLLAPTESEKPVAEIRKPSEPSASDNADQTGSASLGRPLQADAEPEGGPAGTSERVPEFLTGGGKIGNASRRPTSTQGAASPVESGGVANASPASGAEGTSAVTNTDDGQSELPTGGVTQVVFPEMISDLVTVMTQVRLSPPLPDYPGAAVFETSLGQRQAKYSSTLSQVLGKTVLLVHAIELGVINPFRKLEFTSPIPSGTLIEIYDCDKNILKATLKVP